MTQTPALFVATVIPGSPHPAVVFGPYVCGSRRELTGTVDYVLRSLDCSDRTRRGVNLVKVWREIQRRGNGAAGFILEDATSRVRVHFHNMTPDELDSWEADDD